jgi:cell pole-organizing protein PopZ
MKRADLNEKREPVRVETLDDLSALIRAKREEAEACREQMVSTAQRLFEREPISPGIKGWAQHIQTGIAIYDGVRTGLMIFRRVKGMINRIKS